AVVEFTLFDARARIGEPKDKQAAMPQVIALMGDNIAAFAPQLGRLQPFTLRCYAKEIAPMAEFVATLSPDQMTSQRSQGLLQMRNGLSDVFAGVLKAVREERYD